MCKPNDLQRVEDPEADGEPASEVENLAQRRADVDRAAQFMVQTFGPEALTRAEQVEATATHPHFAASVIRAVARLLAERTH